MSSLNTSTENTPLKNAAVFTDKHSRQYLDNLGLCDEEYVGINVVKLMRGQQAASKINRPKVKKFSRNYD